MQQCVGETYERGNNSLPRQHTGWQFSPGWGDNIRTVLQQNTSWPKKHQHGQTVSFFSALALKELLKILGWCYSTLGQHCRTAIRRRRKQLYYPTFNSLNLFHCPNPLVWGGEFAAWHEQIQSLKSEVLLHRCADLSRPLAASQEKQSLQE